MGLKRRSFLQRAGLVLAALGVSETVLSLLGDKSFAVPLLDRYYQALAQPSGRKLALLVGINQYPRGTQTRSLPSLQGCVTDVELQRELLIHRFGFHPSDILTLTDSQATRQNIETAFLEHLTGQAAAGDVVLFHFSGCGSRVRIRTEEKGLRTEFGADESLLSPQSILREGESVAAAKQLAPTLFNTQNSLVPVDGVLLTKGAPANDLLEETLLLLLRSLPTDQVTTVLDTSYTDADTVLQGNLRIRSALQSLAEQASDEELAFQEQLLLRLKSSREQLHKQHKPGQMPGIVLAAAGPSQLATEAPWGGFSAGLFTYALTQHLWQATPPTTLQVSFSRVAGVVEQLVGKEQQPQLSGQKSNQPSLLPYQPEISIGADGVVTAVEDSGKTVHLWLAGLPAPVLEYYGANSLLSASLPMSEAQTPDSNATGEVSSVPAQLQLQIRSKEGLTAKARLVGTADTSNLQVGQLVQESVRVLPKNIGLTIALDAGLERIERVDATSAFASVRSVSSVVTAGEQPADYLFGKVQTPNYLGRYGLFSLGRDLIPNTVGESGEAVKAAVNRLVPKLRTLLTAKLLRLTVNEGSSRLGVGATLEMIYPAQKVFLKRETLRRTGDAVVDSNPRRDDSRLYNSKIASEGGIPTIPIGSRIQYRVQNYSDRPIYLMLIGVDSSGSGVALYPLQFPEVKDSPDAKPMVKDVVVEAGATLVVPQPSASFELTIHGPSGLEETLLICSWAPFTQMATVASVRGSKGEGVGELFKPLTVAQAVLQDLHQASTLAKRHEVEGEAIASVPVETIGISSDSYALDVKSWATLSFIYQVV
ncbi:caspase family protein [Coleofasciculus sp. H7-2]|uniref:caspase family protein n=1 Tax=Coleofasciculus sp. H7-2 TaxID=3351545 RepID=UPI00366AE215